MAHLREHHPDLYTEADQQHASESCGRRGNAKRDRSNRGSNSTIGGPTTS